MDIKKMMEDLRKPFPSSVISWRVGSTNRDKTKCIPLAYLDARAVMDRLDEVFGINGWQSTLDPLSDGFQCKLSCKFGDEWVTKSDVSDFSNIDALKGGASGALKRAAVSFGIGRYLYDLPNIWVDMKDGRYIAVTPKLPDWALPDDEKGKDQKTKVDELHAESTSQSKPVVNTAPSTQQAPAQSLDYTTFKFTGGKNQGKTLAECDRGYLTWTVEKSQSPQPIKDMIKQYLDTTKEASTDNESAPF